MGRKVLRVDQGLKVRSALKVLLDLRALSVYKDRLVHKAMLGPKAWDLRDRLGHKASSGRRGYKGPSVHRAVLALKVSKVLPESKAL